MMNAEVQKFQQKKQKEDDNSLTCIKDDNPTLVIFDAVNRGKDVTSTTCQKMAVFGTTRHVLHGVSATLIGCAVCQ